MPTPPTTVNAPVVVDVLELVLANVNVLLYVGALVPLLTNMLPTVPVLTNPVTPAALWYTSCPTEPLLILVVVTERPTNKVAVDTKVAVFPICCCNKLPTEPVEINAVIPTLDWIGILPAVPPEILVEVVAIPLNVPNIVPPTYKFSPMPTPPTTVNAPVVVDVDDVVFNTDTATVVDEPLLVTLCSVPVFHTVIVPVFALTAVSVPAVNVCTPKLAIVKLVKVPVDTILVTPI